MNKLEEYRDQLANKLKHDTHVDIYMDGFNAAIALDLPVKFSEWRSKTFSNTTHVTHPQFWTAIDNHSWKFMDHDDSFKYWIEHVYDPKSIL